MDIEDILNDFVNVCGFSNIPNFKRSDIQVEEGHPVKGLGTNIMAVYIFMHGYTCLKVGKAGPKSKARYIYRHYNPKFGNSNLSRSLLNDKEYPSTEKIDDSNVKDWIKNNTQRINLLLDEHYGIFVLNLLESFLHCRLHPKFEGFEKQRKMPGDIGPDEEVLIDESQFWNGYCPECMLNGKRSRMRLNGNDLYECEGSGLQLAVSIPGVQAVVMNFRGKGEFRSTKTYADTIENGELLFLQDSDYFPYNNGNPINSLSELKDYITQFK